MIDDGIDAKEQEMILALVRQNFSLITEQATALIELAEQQRLQATDIYRFISLINKEYSQEQKIKLIESMWKIAFIDGVLDLQEEYLIRKIANLLYAPHTAYILTKNRVNNAQ